MGREREEGDRRRVIELIGVVRAQTHKVNIIRGADRWSRVRSGPRERDEWVDGWSEVAMKARIKRCMGRARQALGSIRRGVRRRGRMIFSIYLR